MIAVKIKLIVDITSGFTVSKAKQVFFFRDFHK